MVLSMDRWVGKVAIVTGASAGIGAAICKQLAEAGMKVVGFARRPERVDELAKSLKDCKGSLVGYKVDVTKEDEIKKGFNWTTKTLGPVHVLINNAGIALQSSLTDGETADWKRLFDTNVMGLCICTREAYKIMKENNIDGHIVHINSVLGHEVIKDQGVNVYCASKFAVTALAETLRVEFNSLKSKIKITSVSPGAVKTDILEAANIPVLWAHTAHILPEDIADSVLYVLSTPPNVLIKELTVKPVGEKF